MTVSVDRLLLKVNGTANSCVAARPSAHNRRRSLCTGSRS